MSARIVVSGRHTVLPGFGLAFGYTVLCLCLIVLLPLAGLATRAASVGLESFLDVARDPRVLSALKISFGISFVAAVVASTFGLLVAWVLTRYRFPGRKVVDALVDLPFALPTAVAGIALASLYAPSGPIGVVVRSRRHQDRVHTSWHFHCACFHRAAVCRAHRAAHDRRDRAGVGGSFRHTGREAIGHADQDCSAVPATSGADRICARLRARHRGISATLSSLPAIFPTCRRSRHF